MDTLWLTAPHLAYADWQAREAAGADRRPFAERSIVQHRAMFDRFHRHLVAHGATVATFGPDLVEAFWQGAEAAAQSPATRMRYLKLLDRLCRHLVHSGVRTSNPAEELARNGRWPQDEPDPFYLPEDVDARLQEFVQPLASDDVAQLRMRAIVALFLGTGISAAEGRVARLGDLWPDATPPYLHVPAKRHRPTRTVHLEPFAVAALDAWKTRRTALPMAGDLLFALRRSGKAITDMSLGNIVREAIEAVGYEA